MANHAARIDDRNRTDVAQSGASRHQAWQPFVGRSARAADAPAVDCQLTQRGVGGGERFADVFRKNERQVVGARFRRFERARPRRPQIGGAESTQHEQYANRERGDARFTHDNLTYPTLMTMASAERPVVVIGAGPAGLTAAYDLTRRGVPTVVFDADVQVGGLAKTVVYKNFRFDIGGHRFFTKV